MQFFSTLAKGNAGLEERKCSELVTNSTKLTNAARTQENELNCKIQGVLAKRVKLNNFSNGSNVQLVEVKVY